MEPGLSTYELYFRLRRGSHGVAFALARAEFLAAAHGLPVLVSGETPARMRLQFTCAPSLEPALVRRAGFLGYSVALSRVTPVPEHAAPVLPGRSYSGRVLRGIYRVGGQFLRYEPLWAADEEEHEQSSPHRREFLLDVDGSPVPSMARRRFRRLSVCDARLLLNLARLPESATILDPYAGIGGIVQEAVSRGLQVICGDVDPCLRPGLSQLSQGLSAVWDAAALPLQDACCNAVITEPPYLAAAHEAVAASVPELARCVAPGGFLSILATRELSGKVLAAARRIGLQHRESHELRREGSMVCDALVLRRPR